MASKSIIYKLFVWYWPIVMFNYFLLMGTGINLTVFLVDVPLVLFLYKAYTIWNKKSQSLYISLLGIYAILVLLSVIAYGFNNTPFICYLNGFQYFFVPLCFAPLGFSFSVNHDYNRYYLYACLFCFAIGLFLFATLPPIYMDYLASTQGYEDWSQEKLYGISRFSSFLPTSYDISYLSIPALILSLSYSSNKEAGIKGWLCYLISGISFVAAIMCQQRIAMFFAVLVMAFYPLYLSKGGNKKIILMIIGVIILLYIIISNYLSDMAFYEALRENIIDRFEKMDYSKAMAGRSGQFSSFNRATWWSYIIGLGMGSCGHLVIPFNLQAIYDGEFVKLFYEFGFFGTVLFIVLIFMSLVRGIKLFKYYHAEVLIMLFFLGACLGASALSFFIYNSMFWFAMGRIWNNDYLYLRKQEMLKNTVNKNSIR